VIVFAVFAVFAQDIESFLPSKKWKDCDFSVSRDREGERCQSRYTGGRDV
jgi:hypothetical protein